MKSIKVNPGETFELIITDDKGNDIAKQCYEFDPLSVISHKRTDGYLIKMELMPVTIISKLVNSQEVVLTNKPFDLNTLH